MARVTADALILVFRVEMFPGSCRSPTVIPLLYRGLVSKLKPEVPKYYHGTYPGAVTGILRNGFKASCNHHFHEFTNAGGAGVYTHKENCLSTPQNGVA